jgi:hypothetical protein
MDSFKIKKIFLADAEETRKWDYFVENHPDGTPYHLTCWLKTIQETYRYEPVLYMITSESGITECVFPLFLIKGFFTNKRIISLPFSDYGGPISNGEIFLLQLIERLRKDFPSFCNNIEIRSEFTKRGSFKQLMHYKRHILELNDDEEKIKLRLNKRTTRYSIRKAEKAGVMVYEDNSRNGLEHFIRLNRKTRNKHGVPSQPDKFFYNLFKNVISKKFGFIHLAEYDDKVIAASMFIRSGSQIHYKYNASDEDYIKKAKPNHLITWSAIKKGILDGYNILDFGRTAADNQGLMRYKQMWGTLELDCVYSFFPKIQGASSHAESSIFYQSATRLWKLLPGYMRTLIGTYIYRYLC